MGQFLLMHCMLASTISCAAAGVIASLPLRAASFNTFLASASFSLGLRSGRSTETHDHTARARSRHLWNLSSNLLPCLCLLIFNPLGGVLHPPDAL